MSALHVVVPNGIDDPVRPSGGNNYDRYVCSHLRLLGCLVEEHAVAGSWPRPDTGALSALAGTMQRIPDGALALIDGLVGSAAAEVLVPEAHRLRLVMLVHMPLGHRSGNGAAASIRIRERAVLEATAAVVTTSRWSRGRLLELYELAPERVHVAEPGAERAELAPGTAHGGELLCVAAVGFEKGHDLLIEALMSMSEAPWRCVCVGSVEGDPGLVEDLRRRTRAGGVEDRVIFAGTRTGADLDRSYIAADLLVLASRAETYGMVITEALAHGLPVVATEVGGVEEALGYGGGGMRPGLLVPPDDPAALAAALRAWLADGELRDRLRQSASERRESLCPWSTTASVLADVIAEV